MTYIDREIDNDIRAWAQTPTPNPLLLLGPKGCGKTTSVRTNCSPYFETIVTLDFATMPYIKACFNSLKFNDLIHKLEMALTCDFVPGGTLLLVKNISQFPRGLMGISIINKHLPNLHIVCLDAHLALLLKTSPQQSVVKNMTIKQMGTLNILEFIRYKCPVVFSQFPQVSATHTLTENDHSEAVFWIRVYCIVGGFPSKTLALPDISYDQEKSEALLSHVQQEISTDKSEADYFSDLLDKSPSNFKQKHLMQFIQTASKLIGVHVKPKLLNPKLATTLINKQLAWFSDSSYLIEVNGITSPADYDKKVGRKKSRLYFQDISLINNSCTIRAYLLQIAAHYFHTHLSDLVYWVEKQPNRISKTDFLWRYKKNVLPVDIDTKPLKYHRALRQYKEKFDAPIGIRLSLSPLSYTKGILDVPIYLIGELDRLINNQLGT